MTARISSRTACSRRRLAHRPVAADGPGPARRCASGPVRRWVPWSPRLAAHPAARRHLAMERVAAPPADHEAPQEPAGASRGDGGATAGRRRGDGGATAGLPTAVAVLAHLRLRRLEDRGADQGRHRDLDPLLARRGDPGARLARRMRAPAQGPQARRRLDVARAPEHGAPHGGGVAQHQRDGGGVPPRLAGARGHGRPARGGATPRAGPGGPARSARTSGGPEPGVLGDLDAGRPAALVLGHVAAAGGPLSRRADRPGARGVATPASAARPGILARSCSAILPWA